jgi:transposase-like protein
LDVEQWAELRREHFVRGVSIKELSRRFGLDRGTVRRALRSEGPPRYERPGAAVQAGPVQGRDPRACFARIRGCRGCGFVS